MSHELRISATADGDVLVACTEPGHDFSRIVLTPDDVRQARTEHDTDQETRRPPGLYQSPAQPGLQPLVYRKDPDGTWWAVSTWSRCGSAPLLGRLGLAGPLPEVFDQ